jgi:hypothetical protein
MTLRAARWMLLALLTAAVGGGLVAAACGGAQHGQLLQPTRETGPLLRPAQIPADFVWRQRIDVRFKERRESFSAVIEKRGDHLILLALTPFGSRAFALEQRGSRTTFTPYIDIQLPFSPLYILVDVQRAFFRGLPGAALSDGWHEGVADGERIRERWAAGRLFEREYRSLDQSGNQVSIEYRGGMLGFQPAPTIQLTSRRFGYALTITTLLAQRLPATAP